ncbi:MAG: ATP-grasp domain-containing protein [Candidatus Sumerlaeia bacterium]|nr:ATP-grasp domain-containing protein [Candidatus Sumerlaeia bacterium]
MGAPQTKVPPTMRVLMVSPHFPAEQEQFSRALKETGAELYAIADVPEQQLPGHVRGYLSGYMHVPSLFEEQAIVDAAAAWLRGREPERIECLWEPFVLLAARLRERFGVPGMSYEVIRAFRDKDLMKKKVRAAGLRVPKSERARTVNEIWAAIERIGYPVIVKPIAGAGSADTYRLDSKGETEAILPRIAHVEEVNVEEFITGDEFTFDAVSINGKAAFHSVSQYHPCPLDARSHEWISPGQITFRDPDREARIAPGVKLGHDILRAMEMGTGFTHMEWFLTPAGEAVFSEIGVRNGGGHLVDMMNYSNDFDVFRGWAQAVMRGRFEEPIQRKYHVGMTFKRAEGQGYIRHIEGMDRVRARLGAALVWDNLLPVGAHRRDWTKTLLSDGFLCFRHESYSEVRAMLEFAVNNVRMYASP